MRKNLLTIFNVIVAVLEFLSQMKSDTVKQTSMTFSIIDNHIMTSRKSINGGHDALISEIEKERILFLFELSENLLKLLVISGLSAHHSRPHRISKSVLSCSFGISLTDGRMIGQSKIVVEAPVKHRNAIEDHVRAKLPF